MDDQMRLRGELRAHFLKTRSSDGVGKNVEMHFDKKNLRICDKGTNSNNGVFIQLKVGIEKGISIVIHVPSAPLCNVLALVAVYS